ncbi:MAG TPA: lytic transglycosylase domain-containing protein [Thermodesulfobacteriota bacterium]|nr:lytic transglycosylase domain-containing protein [Thermodesulfobacteriota bacterium]
MSEIETVEAGEPKVSSEQAFHLAGVEAKWPLKKIMLINGIVVAVLLAAGAVFALITIRNAPMQALAAENKKLKEEIRHLQELSPADGERTAEVIRVETLISRLQPRLGIALAEPIAAAVVRASQQYDLPPELIVSIIFYESGFEVNAESEDGSAGLMQISPRVYRSRLVEMGISEHEAFHISKNINLGCSLLREFLNQGESIELAIAKLVGNESRVDEILVGFTNTMIATSPRLETGNAE